MSKLLDLLIGFGRAGLLGYGGGPSAIPLVEKEVVDNYHWMTKDEFANVLALGNALPGPIATKMSGYIGFKVAGYVGAAIAIGATILPTVIVMILFAAILGKYAKSPVIQGMINGVKPVVFVLLALLAFDYVKFASSSLTAIIIAAVSLVAMRFLSVNPAFIILAALAYGAFFIR